MRSTPDANVVRRQYSTPFMQPRLPRQSSELREAIKAIAITAAAIKGKLAVQLKDEDATLLQRSSSYLIGSSAVQSLELNFHVSHLFHPVAELLVGPMELTRDVFDDLLEENLDVRAQ